MAKKLMALLLSLMLVLGAAPAFADESTSTGSTGGSSWSGMTVAASNGTVTADLTVGSDNYIRAFIMDSEANPVT